jgi:ubiquitin C-terminal hydrolase
MEECFQAYFAQEVIPDVECEGCRGRHSSTQRVQIARAPEVLLITLKRFEFVNEPEPHAIRMNGEIDVLPELDLATLPGGGNGRYRLTGIVHHLGTGANGGHYVADVLHPDDGFMYKANDGYVAPRMDGYPALRSNSAYILMYERI